MSGHVKRRNGGGASVQGQGALHPDSPMLAATGPEGAHRFFGRGDIGGQNPSAQIESLIKHCVVLLEHQSAVNAELANVLLAISSKASVMGEMNPSDELSPPQGQPMAMLTVTGLAELLAVDPRTIRRWRSAGHLPPALSVGGVIRWRAEVIDKWISAREGAR